MSKKKEFTTIAITPDLKKELARFGKTNQSWQEFFKNDVLPLLKEHRREELGGF